MLIKNFRNIYVTIAIVVCLWCKGQQINNSFPDVYTSTFTNFVGYDNPAYIPKEGRFSLYSQYKQRLGQFSKIVSFSAYLDKTWRRENKSTNSIRAIFWNENLGPYISRPRFSVGYANELNLSEKVKLGLGLSLGATSINFSAQTQGGTGNSYLPDGKIGLMLKIEKLTLGLASLQIFNAKSKIVGNDIRLKRYWDLYTKYSTDLSAFWQLDNFAAFDYRTKDEMYLQIGTMATYNEKISFGLSHRTNYTSSVLTKITFFEDKSPISVLFCYNSPIFSKKLKELNSLELGVTFSLY